MEDTHAGLSRLSTNNGNVCQPLFFSCMMNIPSLVFSSMIYANLSLKYTSPCYVLFIAFNKNFIRFYLVCSWGKYTFFRWTREFLTIFSSRGSRFNASTLFSFVHFYPYFFYTILIFFPVSAVSLRYKAAVLWLSDLQIC